MFLKQISLMLVEHSVRRQVSFWPKNIGQHLTASDLAPSNHLQEGSTYPSLGSKTAQKKSSSISSKKTKEKVVRCARGFFGFPDTHVCFVLTSGLTGSWKGRLILLQNRESTSFSHFCRSQSNTFSFKMSLFHSCLSFS